VSTIASYGICKYTYAQENPLYSDYGMSADLMMQSNLLTQNTLWDLRRKII
jgi:hypothetical protein